MKRNFLSEIQNNLVLTKRIRWFFFLILTSDLQSSHWCLTLFLNHVTRHVAWTCWDDPAHLHGAISFSSPLLQVNIFEILCTFFWKMNLPLTGIFVSQSFQILWKKVQEYFLFCKILKSLKYSMMIIISIQNYCIKHKCLLNLICTICKLVQ